MKTTLSLLLGMAAAAGCGGSAHHTDSAATTLTPDDFVLRDVRKDAARHLNCQVPMINTELGAWIGGRGNVTAMGCGYQITYYLACNTSHQCNFTVAD